MTFWLISFVFFGMQLLCVFADWPVPKSIKCNSTGTFHCKNTGQYEDPFDFTCTKYFLCNEFTHEMVEVELTCPENTFYDPVNEVCSTGYTCICEEDTKPTTTAPTTISSSVKTLLVPYPDECKICSQCITSVGTESTTTSTATWTTSYPVTNSQYSSSTKISSTTEDTIASPTVPKYCELKGKFTCTETGRFADPNDPSCSSYFYCFGWSNGTINKYFYTCSIGLFNPIKGACDGSYKCPCVEATKSETAATSISTQQPPWTSTQSSSSTQLFSTTEDTTASPTILKYCELKGKFTCTETGRFADPNDPSCSSYFYCYGWSNGTINKYFYTCSIGLFNPIKGACDGSYKCPCVEATKSETAATSISTQQPPWTSTQSSSSTQLFSTTEDTTASPKILKYCELKGKFTCTETGRFADPNDPSCSSYFYCYGWSNGTINKYFYTCSIGLFNPIKGACDGSYKCPCVEATKSETAATSISTQQPPWTSSQSSSSIQVSSTTEDTTVFPTIPKDCEIGGNFTCTETGRFADPNDPSCSSYFYCYGWSNGTINKYFFTCSIGLFNPIKGACDGSYKCPCAELTKNETATTSISTQHSQWTSRQSSTSTQVSTTTEDAKVSPIIPNYCEVGGNFTCTKPGRFANPNDSSCSSYFYCYFWSTGAMRQYLYSCSVGIFDPKKGACDPSFVCPCKST